MYSQLISQITDLQLIVYALIIFLVLTIIALWITHRRLLKLTEYYNGFVLFVAEEIETLQLKDADRHKALTTIANNIANQTLADIEDWNELNAKVDLLMQKEVNQEQRAIAVNRILKEIDKIIPKKAITKKKVARMK